MCVSCLVVSALTFIVPVSDVPASNVPQSATASAPTTLVRTQVSPGIVAVKKEIQTVLGYLPNSADAEILRIGLKAASTRLNTATSDQQAQDILDEETDKLAEVVRKAPNARQITDILLDIRDLTEPQQLKNGTGAVELQSSAALLFLRKGLQLA